MGQGCSAVYPYRSTLHHASPLLPFHSNKAFSLPHVRRMAFSSARTVDSFLNVDEKAVTLFDCSIVSREGIFYIFFPPSSFSFFPLSNLHFLTHTRLFPQTTSTNQHDSQSRYQRVSALSLLVISLGSQFPTSLLVLWDPCNSFLTPCPCPDNTIYPHGCPDFSLLTTLFLSYTVR